MEKFQAVLFDFDGVLGNTHEDNLRAWREAFSMHGLDIDERIYLLMEGKKSNEIVRHLLQLNRASEELADQIIEKKHELYALQNAFCLYEGVQEVVQRLRDLNIKLGVVSGGSGKRLHGPSTSEIMSCFDVVITGDDCILSKPSPEPYLKAAEKLKVEPTGCLVVENAPLGIKSAKTAGMTCFALCSTLKPNDLEEADLVVKDIAELSDCFDTIFTLEE